MSLIIFTATEQRLYTPPRLFINLLVNWYVAGKFENKITQKVADQL